MSPSDERMGFAIAVIAVVVAIPGDTRKRVAKGPEETRE